MSTPARARALAVAILFGVAVGTTGRGQEAEVEVERPAPPALDDLETDKNPKDGIPDGWYNARDVKLVAEGGVVGPHCLKFECRKPGRPARLSRIFGVDGRKTEAVVIGLWVRLDQAQAGERLGDDPGLIVDFLGEAVGAARQQSRGMIGPWTRKVGPQWTRVAQRIPVPPGAREAILSVGLLGATGVLEVDGITFDLVPVGGRATTNLVLNGGFDLGTPDPTHWLVDNGARRAFPGQRPALELSRTGARAMTGLALPVGPFNALEVTVAAKAAGLRGAGGAAAAFFFLDDDGRPVPGSERGVPVFTWSGTHDWRLSRAVVPVPNAATRAVLQFEKSDGVGNLFLDDVEVVAAPNPDAGAWTPYHVEDDTSGWTPVRPSTAIAPKSALDASFLLDAPAGKHGFVMVREGRLAFTKGGRARFFGVALMPPAAFLEPEKADALADRLARSGVNLVRVGDLDTALGPDRSLFDDTRDDTRAFDPVALEKFDHLVAALKQRGIYLALELQSARRFRSEDGVRDAGLLPIGGGPAAAFDPTLTKREIETAKALLTHVNPETKLALRDDPALAWVTLAGELSLFDLIDDPAALPTDYARELKEMAAKSPGVVGRRFWSSIEAGHWKEVAEELRRANLRVPIASVAHWRREPEFVQALQGPGLDLIDDRLFFTIPPWVSPDRRALVWSTDGGLLGGAVRKRQPDRPYVVGQWAHQTHGAWALPYEGADALLAAVTAMTQDWDALARRGVFVHPEVWGANAAGTGGGEDIFQIPEVVNGIPQAYSLWPHAASILLRGHRTPEEPERAAQRRPGLLRRRVVEPIEGWDPTRGRLVVNTPYTQGVAGWSGDIPAIFEKLEVETREPYAVVVVSSAGKEPIARTRRLLVTALARIEPTGFRWVDDWRREVADPGRPPLLQEPVTAKVRWKRSGEVKAYALDNNGARTNPVALNPTNDGVELFIDGTASTLHWELVVE